MTHQDADTQFFLPGKEPIIHRPVQLQTVYATVVAPVDCEPTGVPILFIFSKGLKKRYNDIITVDHGNGDPFEAFHVVVR